MRAPLDTAAAAAAAAARAQMPPPPPQRASVRACGEAEAGSGFSNVSWP